MKATIFNRLHIEDTTGLSLPVEWDVWTPPRISFASTHLFRTSRGGPSPRTTVQAALPIEAGHAAHALHHPDEPLDFHHDMSDSSTCPSTSTASHDSSATLPPKLSAPPTSKVSKVRDLKRDPVSKQAARRLKKRLANLQEHRPERFADLQHWAEGQDPTIQRLVKILTSMVPPS
ncbi:hypothetical protein OC834_003948 [Tilletia horrida]|nr:hypothetical protein OC834_003948 [Tilletia horrida]